MNITELKKAVYAIVKGYFGTAQVIWANQKRVKPASPLVILRIVSLSENVFPIEKIGEEDVFLQTYPSRMLLEVQLFVRGVPVSEGGKMTVPDNTAVNDLSDFVHFIGSEYVRKLCREKDICILPEGNIQDLDALVNDSSREHRAMQQFTVDFLQQASGVSGSCGFGDGWHPPASGGGDEQLAGTDVGYFVEAEIEQRKDEDL